MSAFLIAKRDLGAYLHGLTGYIIIAGILFLQGVAFNVFAMGQGAKFSHEVLEQFFNLSSGFTMVAAVLLTMRAIAEERQTGTDVLLHTAPVSERSVVLGKYFAAMAMLTLLTALTIYMPALIFVNGKVSYAHIAVGYLGVLCLGSAAASIGIFASSLFRNQLAAAIIGGVIVVSMLLFWMLADQTEPPFSAILGYAALFDKHFTPFMKGKLLSTGVVYYGSVSFLFLSLATRVLEGRRWQ